MHDELNIADLLLLLSSWNRRVIRLRPILMIFCPSVMTGQYPATENIVIRGAGHERIFMSKLFRMALEPVELDEKDR